MIYSQWDKIVCVNAPFNSTFAIRTTNKSGPNYAARYTGGAMVVKNSLSFTIFKIL